MASAGARRSRLKPCLCRLSIRLAILPSLYAACFPLLSFHVIGWVLEIRFMAAPEGYISGWLFAKRFCPLCRLRQLRSPGTNGSCSGLRDKFGCQCSGPHLYFISVLY